MLANSSISDRDLTALIDEVETHLPGHPATFFEATTAMAFLAFSRCPADVLLLETGLGGRLDATNMLDTPLATVITTIGMDHTEFLGNTLSKIAQEKAGIMRNGIPCIIGQQPQEALEALTACAREKQVPAYLYGRDWKIVSQNQENWHFQGIHHHLNMLPFPSLSGEHQRINAATALATLECCASTLPFSEKAIHHGLTHAQWPARLQPLACETLHNQLPKTWELWLDGGHNAAAAAALAHWASSKRPTMPLHLIVGMLNNKDIHAFLQPFAKLAEGVTALPIQDENSFDTDAITQAAQAIGLHAMAAPNIQTALHTLVQQGKQPKRVIICGSLYLAGEVLAQNA